MAKCLRKYKHERLSWRSVNEYTHTSLVPLSSAGNLHRKFPCFLPVSSRCYLPSPDYPAGVRSVNHCHNRISSYGRGVCSERHRKKKERICLMFNCDLITNMIKCVFIALLFFSSAFSSVYVNKICFVFKLSFHNNPFFLYNFKRSVLKKRCNY